MPAGGQQHRRRRSGREVRKGGRTTATSTPTATLRVDKGDLPACGEPDSHRDADDRFDPDWADLAVAARCRLALSVQAPTPLASASSTCQWLRIWAPPARLRRRPVARTPSPSPVLPPAIRDVAVEIQVGGAPSSISTDAPAYVDAAELDQGHHHRVDDEGVRVGAIPASVIQVEGSGKVIAGEGEVMTSDGTVKFTYLAPSSRRHGRRSASPRVRFANSRPTSSSPSAPRPRKRLTLPRPRGTTSSSRVRRTSSGTAMTMQTLPTALPKASPPSGSGTAPAGTATSRQLLTYRVATPSARSATAPPTG